MAAIDSFFVRFKNPLMLIAIVLAQVLALAMQVQRPARGVAQFPNMGGAPDGRHVALARHWAVAVATPLERLATATSQHIQSAWFDYIDLRHTRQHDLQLHATIGRLREEQAADAADAAQGRRLQKLLAFKEQYIAATVAAQVIGTSGTDRSRILYLDKGAADGLRPEQAVITPDGIVGKLRDVFPHTAQVVLIDDATSGAGVVLEPSQIRGILRGTASGQVQIDNLTADSRIKPGEQVLTSGGDMVFPRGLPVGVIQSIAPDPSHQPFTAITIKPAANLQQLSEVLVITAMQSTLTPAAQTDAAQAESTSLANQRAADILAARLPSLHPASANDAATSTGAPQPASTATNAADPNTTPAPPKPQPALHPDQFSPGATPPAQDLTPGEATQPDTAAPRPKSSAAPPQQP